MLIATLPITTELTLNTIPADGIEFRIDYLKPFNIDVIAKLKKEINLPVIFTLRKRSHGGFCDDPETIRLATIIKLCELNPDYIDLEYDTSRDFIDYLKLTFPQIKLIGSYHNLDKTPDDLISILKAMHYPAFQFYKIATFANSTIDALRMLLFAKSQPAHITALCMGELGSITRILSPLVGNTFTYASLSNKKATAQGQLALSDLIDLYHYKKLNQATQIYALLGNPIEKSVGHILHNQAFDILNKNAVYIKLAVLPDELATLFHYCKLLPFKGFSITMPLKEKISSFIDQNSNKLSAINTITIKNHLLIGYNTDGLGAIKALNKHTNLDNKIIVILGAGGAAYAIANAAKTMGANVIIFNRTLAKAKQIAATCQGLAYSTTELARLKNINYSVIINTIPISIIKTEQLRPSTFAMDIVYQPINTPFLQAASNAGCICIPGYYMYIEQALLQLEQWLQPNAQDDATIRQLMTAYFV